MKYFRLALAVVVVLVFPLTDHSQNTLCTGTCGKPATDCSQYCYQQCHKGMCGMAACLSAHRPK